MRLRKIRHKMHWIFIFTVWPLWSSCRKKRCFRCALVLSDYYRPSIWILHETFVLWPNVAQPLLHARRYSYILQFTEYTVEQHFLPKFKLCFFKQLLLTSNKLKPIKMVSMLMGGGLMGGGPLGDYRVYYIFTHILEL